MSGYLRGKVFVRAEKCLACDLRAGDLFIMEMPDTEYFSRELNEEKVAIVILLRTNVSDEGLEDREQIVYRLNITATQPGEAAPAKVNPHAPPGMKEQ